MVGHTCNPSTCEQKQADLYEIKPSQSTYKVAGQPRVHSETLIKKLYVYI